MAVTKNDSFVLTLPSDREIEITRVFDAPRELVFEVMTNPEHLRRWWGPRAMTLVGCELDFQVGGRYRFVLSGPDGSEAAFRGEYLEIDPPARVVSTFEFEGLPGHVSVETMTLEDLGAKTRLTTRCVYQSQEDRDGHLHSGMESGARETHSRLAELLAELIAQ